MTSDRLFFDIVIVLYTEDEYTWGILSNIHAIMIEIYHDTIINNNKISLIWNRDFSF